MKEQFYRFLAVICFIGFVAAPTGFEWGVYGIIGWLMRTMLFFAGMVVFHKFAEAEHTRRIRKVTR